MMNESLTNNIESGLNAKEDKSMEHFSIVDPKSNSKSNILSLLAFDRSFCSQNNISAINLNRTKYQNNKGFTSLSNFIIG